MRAIRGSRRRTKCRPHAVRTSKVRIVAPDAVGVVAVSDGEVVGFAVMQSFLANPTHMTAAFFSPRCTNLGYASHAAAAGREYDVYREMYAALADDFVSRGYFDHNVYVAPRDAAVIEAFSSLGFGRTVVAGLRGVEPVEGAPAAGAVQMHQASAEDAEVIFSLNDELNRHHARAPIFWPHLARDAGEQPRDAARAAEGSRRERALGGVRGRQAGRHEHVHGAASVSPLLSPEKTIYLFQGIVSREGARGGVGTAILSHGAEWAREQGYEHIALHFASPNLSGARFWQSSGFVPVEYGMRAVSTSASPGRAHDRTVCAAGR